MVIVVKSKDRMSKEVVSVEKHASLKEASKLMINRSIGALIVMENSEPVGMITERDILKAFVDQDNTEIPLPVASYMTSPLISVKDDDPISKAAQMMLIKRIRRLGVIDDNKKIVGFLNIRDILLGVHESFLSLFEV